MRSDMDSWAKPIQSFDRIPEIFRDSLDFLPDGEDFPEMIYSPEGVWGNRKTNPKLVFFRNNTVTFLEKKKKGVLGNQYSLKDIVCIETGNILLHAWINITGFSENAWKTSGIEFNSVCEGLFNNFITLVRSGLFGIGTERMENTGKRFAFLQKTDFKYATYGQESILNGERLNNLVYQPQTHRLFLRFFRRIAIYSHLTILTDCECIFLSGNPGGRYMKYGIMKRFVPLAKISNSAILFDEKKTTSIVSIRLVSGEEIHLGFAENNQNSANSLIDELSNAKKIME